MAIALDSVTNGFRAAGGNGATVTVAHTCVAGTTALFVAVAVQDSNQHANQTTSVTYNGVSMTKIATADNSGEERSEIWFLASPTTGSSLNVVVTYNNLNYVGVGITSFTGSVVTTPTVFNTTINTSGASPTTSVTTTVNNSWLIDAVCSQSVESVSGGQTLDWQNANQSFQNGAGSHKATTTAGSYSMGWTNTGGNGVGHTVVAIAPAVTGSSIKTVNGLAKASVKTVNGLVIASVKTINGLA